jgi:hypothetical protein
MSTEIQHNPPEPEPAAPSEVEDGSADAFGEMPEESAVEPAPGSPQDIAPPLTFWQQPMVQNVLPFVTSLAVHVGIILVGFLTFAGYQAARQVVEEQIIVPEAAIVEGAEVGGIPNPGLGGDPTRAAAQDEIPDASPDSQSWAERPSETLNNALMGGSDEETPTDALIGPSMASLSRGAGSGQGPGGPAAGGVAAPFGMPGGGGGIGPSANFVGISGNARRVVYICDATGTMLGLKFELLKKQLFKAIDVLKPIQGFNVIFFKGGDSDKDWANPFSKELEVARPATKQRATQFIETFQVLGKGTNPLPALRMAFTQKPQLVYFLTDGQFDNVVSYEQVLAEVRRLNADKSVKVNTIAFMSEDEKAEEALEKMAKENGGTFRKVTEKDLD